MRECSHRLSLPALVQRNDLHGRVRNRAEEFVERRFAPHELQPRPGALAEDDVRDPFALGEGDQTVGRPVRLDPHDRRPEALRQPDVLLQGLGVPRADAARLLARRLHVHGVPLGAQPAGDPGAGPDDPRRERVRAHADHDPLGDQRRLQALARTIGRGLLADFVGHRAQRQLTKRRQVALAEEVRERLLDLLRAIDLSLLEAGSEAPRPSRRR